MAKKDFSSVNTNPVYNVIAEATAEQLPGQLELETAPGVTEPRKDRKTYTQAEKDEYQATLRTAGRKGCKLPRINLAFAPDLYDYVRTMARARGETITDFCNHILRQSMDENREVYEKAIEFRKSF